MTVQIDRDTCKTDDFALAESQCHLVKLEGVFMLHFVAENQLRLTFFGQKVKPSDFFVPYNTWIHI
jgi:hypothetical protein